jgi:thiol-disulfide isomerase/thioredoxin
MNTWFNKTKMRSLLVLSAFVLGTIPGTAGPLKEGSPFPDLTRCGMEGKLPDLHGKVVLVDFFASWCQPCQESFPVMEELYQKYGSKGFVIVAVNLDTKKGDLDKFLKRHPTSFTVVRDADNKLVQQIQIPTMPSSFLLDRHGKVYASHNGFKGEETKKQYTAEIEALLK